MNKKVVTPLLFVSMAAALTVGGTLAFFSAKTDTKNNTFTMGRGLDGDIDEPNWNEENAQNFTPGKVIAKDPLIKNTSAADTEPAFVAADLQYQVQDADGNWVDCSYADLDKFINIKSGNPLADGFNTTDWTMSEDMTAAYYNEKVAAQTNTSPIFDAVEIDRLALTPEQVASAAEDSDEVIQFDITKYEVTDGDGNVTSYTYTDYTMKNFRIVVTGYLAQGSAEFTDARNAMETAFPDVFSR